MAGGQFLTYYSCSKVFSGTTTPSVYKTKIAIGSWAKFPRNNGGKRAVWKSALTNGYYPIAAYSCSYDRISLVLGRETISYLAPGYNPPWSVSVCDTYDCDVGDNSTAPYYNMKDSIYSGSVIAKATANANSQLRNQQMALAETLSEIQKTSNMITNRVERIITAARAVRRFAKGDWSKRNFDALKRNLGSAAPPNWSDPKKRNRRSKFEDLWLEYRYGWTPLYNEIYGGMKALHDGLKNRNQIITVRGRDSHSWTEVGYSMYRGQYYTSNLGGTYGATGGTTKQTHRYKVTAKRDYRVEVGYVVKVTNPSIKATSTLGIDNPALIAWELTPLSFVGDWFVNVSDVLEQMSTFTGSTFVSGWQTVTRRNLYTAEWESAGVNDRQYEKSSGFSAPKCTVDRFDLSRTVLTTPPTFGLHLNNGLNFTRLADAAALARQLFR